MRKRFSSSSLKPKIERLQIIDALRGLAALAMIIHHASFDLEQFYGYYLPFFHSEFFFVLQFIFSGIFIFLCGVSSNFSRNNLKRGIICLAAGAAVTVASLIIFPDMPIYFGILQCLGSCILIYALAGRLLSRLPAEAGVLIWLTVFAVNYYIYKSALPIESPYFFILGFPSYDFSAADYYPLLPYLWLFLSGTALGSLVISRRFPEGFYKFPRIPVLSFLGRNALWVFIFHQPVILLLLRIFFGRWQGV